MRYPILFFSLGFFILICVSTICAQNGDGDLPVNAVAGKCYAKCIIPALIEPYTMKVLVKEASSQLEIIPAKYDTVTERIVTKEAYTTFKIQPASFSTTTKEILIKEAATRLIVVPPIYQDKTEQVLVCPSSSTWIVPVNACGCKVNFDYHQCAVWCLIEIPAQYKTVPYKVLKTPTTTQKTPLPAIYKIIEVATLDQSAKVIEHIVPAAYRTVSKQRLVHPASIREVEIPAEYGEITFMRRLFASSHGGFTDWLEVDCGE